MPSLQTLRNKGGIIVAIVIGIALIAFVLGDLLTSGSTLFGNSQNNVGEINGTTIGAQQYANQVDYVTKIRKISSGSEATSDEQNQEIRNQAWELLVRDYAFKPSVEKLGITTSDLEMEDLVKGANISPVLTSIFANPQTGMFDAEYFRVFISNIAADKTGNLQMFWNYIQKEVADQSVMWKFKALVDKAGYVTNFEAQQMAALQSSSYTVRFVTDKYESIADSTVKVSESEARQYYNKNEKMFRQSSTRETEYIAFDAIPSQEDYVAAEKYFAELSEEFKASHNLIQFASLNSQGPTDARYYREGALAGKLGEFAFNSTQADIYGPTLENDRWTMSRISDIRTIPDSINFSIIFVAPTANALADSLVAELNKRGADFAAAAVKHSIDPQSGANGGVIGTFDPQTFSEILSAPMMSAAKGEVIKVDTPDGINIIKVNNRIGDSRKVQVATVTYSVEPSEQTRNLAYNNANAFATAAGKSISGFNAAAKEKGLMPINAYIGPNDLSVRGLTQSREMVRWAFNGKKGEVSKVMEFGNSFVVAALKEISEEGIAPFDQVKFSISEIIRRDKKAEILAAKMKDATSVDGLASQLSLTAIDGENISFNTFMVPELGRDAAFAGAVTGMDATKISKPAKGNLGVYAIQITNTEASPMPAELVKVQMQAEAENMAFRNAYSSFLEMSNIKDLRYRFY